MRKNALRNATILSCVLAIATLATPRTAFADPSPAEASVARDQFKEGMEAGKTGRWEDARAAFQRSYDVWPRPLTLLNLAGAQAESGKLVLASESYRKFVREASAPGADAKVAEQKAGAQQSLASIEARLPRVRVRVDGQQEGDTVEMDGQPLSNGMLGVYYPADPQEHHLTVMRGGAQVATTTFRLQEKETKDVALVAPPPAAPRATPAQKPDGAAWFKPTPAQPRPAEQPSGGGSIFSSPWFWGITATVVAAGAVTGVVLATSSSGADAPAPYTGNVPPTRIVLR